MQTVSIRKLSIPLKLSKLRYTQSTLRSELNELGLPREDKAVEKPLITKHPFRDPLKVQRVYAKPTATDFVSEKRLTDGQLSYRPKFLMSRSKDSPKVQERCFPSVKTDEVVKRIPAIKKLPLQSRLSIHRHKSFAKVRRYSHGDSVITYVYSASLVNRLATTVIRRCVYSVSIASRLAAIAALWDTRKRRARRAHARYINIRDALRRKQSAQLRFLAFIQERAQRTDRVRIYRHAAPVSPALTRRYADGDLLIRTHAYSASIASRLATIAAIWDARRRRVIRAHHQAIIIRDAKHRKRSAQLRFLALVKTRAERARRTKKHCAMNRRISMPAGIRARAVVAKSFRDPWTRARKQQAARGREAFATRLRKIMVPPLRRRTHPFISDKSYKEDWTEEDRQYDARSAEARRAQVARRREAFTRRLAARELERKRERQVLADIAELPWDEGDLGSLVSGGGGASRGVEKQVDIESIFEELMNFDKGKRDR